MINNVTFLSAAAYVISGWTALAIVIDSFDVILSRDITSIGWYASHPLAIWKLGAGINIFWGILIWLVALVITIATAIALF